MESWFRMLGNQTGPPALTPYARSMTGAGLDARMGRTGETIMNTSKNTDADYNALRDDLAALKGDMANLISHMSDRAASGAQSAANGAQSALGMMDERARDALRSASAEGDRAVKAVGQKVEEQPVTALLIALGIGYIGGRLLPR